MCYNPQVNKAGNIYSCGKCDECHNTYIRQWVFRLQRQQHETPDCLFITLTYDYEHIPMHKGKFTLNKSDYQKFLKRLRKALPHREIKYVLCGEYGSKNGRPHYHAIMFNVNIDDFEIILKSWSLGDIHVGGVTGASIAYTFKYAVKGDIKQRDWRQLKPFVVMSKGLGEKFAFTISHNRIEGIDKNGNNFVRYSKVRTPKKHFQNKLDTLLQQPYYVIPNQNGGTVKMSIPKFYLRAANYDTADLGELYSSVMAKKYSMFSEEKKQEIFARQAIQRKYSVIQQTKNRQHSVDMEKL